MEHQHAWTARWIRPDAGSAPATERMQHRTLYRKTFDVADPAASELLAEVTADSKYRLYVNGTFVLRGPCKGDNWRHYYDTVDLTPYLREGRNAIAVEVVHYPSLLTGGGSDGGPLSEWRADAGGLWLQGALKDKHGSAAETLDTDGTWKLLPCDAVQIGQETKTLFVGGTEDVRGDRIPAGWREAGFDDSAWGVCARPLEPLDRFWGQLMPWQLTPRPIPPLRESEQEFPRLMRAEGIAAAEKSPAGALFPLTVLPGETVALELDAGRLTTGYVQLAVHGGQGGQIDLLYAEAYEYAQPELHGGVRKAVRDDMAGKTLVGNDDRFFPAGWGSAGGPETYEPMGRRAFRFVRVVIRAGNGPLTVARLGWRATGFPLEELGAVRSSDPLTDDMWRISLNTLRGCM